MIVAWTVGGALRPVGRARRAGSWRNRSGRNGGGYSVGLRSTRGPRGRERSRSVAGRPGETVLRLPPRRIAALRCHRRPSGAAPSLGADQERDDGQECATESTCANDRRSSNADDWAPAPMRCGASMVVAEERARASSTLGEVSGPRQHHRGSRGSDRFAAQDPRPRPAIVAPDASAALTSAIENPPSGPITSRSGGGKADRRGPSDRSNSRTEPGPMTSASGTGSTTSGTAPRSDCSAASRATARRRHARGRDRARHASIGDDELEPGHADLGSLADHRLQVIPFSSAWAMVSRWPGSPRAGARETTRSASPSRRKGPPAHPLQNDDLVTVMQPQNTVTWCSMLAGSAKRSPDTVPDRRRTDGSSCRPPEADGHPVSLGDPVDHVEPARARADSTSSTRPSMIPDAISAPPASVCAASRGPSSISTAATRLATTSGNGPGASTGRCRDAPRTGRPGRWPERWPCSPRRPGGRCHPVTRSAPRRRAARARMPDPVPTSGLLGIGQPEAWSSSRQARVVGCSPVPKAIPGSSRMDEVGALRRLQPGGDDRQAADAHRLVAIAPGRRPGGVIGRRHRELAHRSGGRRRAGARARASCARSRPGPGRRRESRP